MKILLLDIETAPNVVHVWGLWNQTVSYKQVLNSSYTLCWAAKWNGEKKVFFSSVYETTPFKMIKGIWRLIDEADVVVHYNGNSFDMPTLNMEFLVHSLPPPAPYKNIDLYLECKQFRFPSRKMDYILQRLGLEGKLHHKGHQLWIDCMGGAGVTDEAYKQAWAVMKRYNKKDLRETQKLYHKVLAWIRSHPNQNIYNDDGEAVCVNCGSKRVHRKAFAYTALGKYKRYRCADCGKWMRGRFTQLDADTKKTMLAPAL